MSLIDEYGENKYQEGIEQIVSNLLKSDEKPEDIAIKADIPLEKVIEIKNKNKL